LQQQIRQNGPRFIACKDNQLGCSQGNHLPYFDSLTKSLQADSVLKAVSGPHCKFVRLGSMTFFLSCERPSQ
jgi:hypothetical protein